MKLDSALVTVSLANIALLTLHLSQDVVYGYESAGANNFVGVIILFVWLYCAIVLIGRRSGYVVLLLASLFAALMPVAHLSGAGVQEDVVQSAGGLLFIWAIFALGVLGTTGFALSVHGLWRVKSNTASFWVWLIVPVLSLAGVLAVYLAYTRT